LKGEEIVRADADAWFIFEVLLELLDCRREFLGHKRARTDNRALDWSQRYAKKAVTVSPVGRRNGRGCSVGLWFWAIVPK
jgi:hypothetical protein